VDDLIAELARSNVDGVLPNVPDRYCTDFGGLIRRIPRAVVRATRELQVVDTLKTARRLGLPVTVRGQGHSCFGQTVTDGLLLLNDAAASAAPPLIDGDLAEVSARSRWREAEAFLNGHGRSFAVQADYLDLSVGGTLSVGGYGVDSVVYGAQVDHVDRIRLIKPDGAAVWCSALENTDLFAYALAGLGQVGVIERAVLRTIPHRAFTALFTYHHPNLGDLVDSMAWLAESTIDRPLLFKALHARGRFVSTYGVQAANLREAISATRRPPLHARRVAHTWITPKYRQWRSLVVKLWVARFANCRRLWTDFLFDYEGLTFFTAFLEPLLKQEPFALCLKSVYIVAIRKLPRSISFPLEASEGIREPMSFGIGLYSMIPARDPDLVTRVADTVSRCLEKCIELGGRPYRYGWHQLSERSYRALYGSTYDQLLALKRELDPQGLFQASRLPERRT
jgi:FAD/FMN-containing dehydrogenase